MIKKILLAEDDRLTAHLVKRRLEQYGFTVMLAANGVEALNIIRAQHVDLLITDVVMPKMDGVDLYLELKKNLITASLPIIIVTDKQVFQESFSALGVNHFVPKASNVNVLLAKIREIGALSLEATPYHKMLICSGNSKIAAEMQYLLQEKDCLATVIENPIEIVSNALAMIPHTVFIDLMIEGDILPSEIVFSLRCYARLKGSIILSFIHLPLETFEEVQNMRELLESRISDCHSAGANGYLGQFNSGSFFESLKQYGSM